MSNYLTTEGLRQVLNAIKERFSKNGHKHTVNDISDLKLVAKTGKYSDLSGLPTIPSVAVAKQNKVGLVMPGDGIVVGDTGALSINVDKESGLYIENNLLKASFTGGESFKTEISAENWFEIDEQLKKVIEENKSNKITDFTVVLKNTFLGKTITIKFDEEKLSNFDSIREYAFTVMEYNNFPKVDSFTTIGGYAKNFDDLKYYELFKLLASDGISDAVEVFFYNYVNPSKAKEQIGKYLQDIIFVYDELERFEQLGIKFDKNLKNIVTTYVYNKDESGTNYIPLSLCLGSYTPESLSEPVPDKITFNELTTIPEMKPTGVEHTLNYIGGENESIRVTFDGEKVIYTIYKYIDDYSKYNGDDYITRLDILGNQFDINFNEFDYGTYVVKLSFGDGTEAYYRVIKTKK